MRTRLPSDWPTARPERQCAQRCSKEMPVMREDSATRTRATRQRAAVSSILDELDDFRSAQDIHAILRSRGVSVGLSTVYRALQALADAGTVDVLRTGDGPSGYRRCSTSHHHHLVCRTCGRTVKVAGPAVERWEEKIGAEYGFVRVTHNVEVFGTCPDCALA